MKNIFIITGRNGTELIEPKAFKEFDVALRALMVDYEDATLSLKHEMDEEEYDNLISECASNEFPKTEQEAIFPIFITIPCSSDYIEWRLDKITL